MMMTTSSSIRVKPLSSLARRFRRVLIIGVLAPSGRESGGSGGIGGAHRSPLGPERVIRRKREGRGGPAPFGNTSVASDGLADALRDRTVGAALEVGARGRI